MYKCNLSYRQFKEYVNLLLELGLLDSQLSEDKKKQILKSTSKGLEFLTKYTELKTLMNLDFSRD
jgi:predicted transcriptional regulator